MNQQPANSPAQGKPAFEAPVRDANPIAQERQAAPPIAEQDLWSGRAHWHSAIGRVLLWLLLSTSLIVGAVYIPRPEWLTQTRLVWTVLTVITLLTLFMLGGVAIRILQTRYRLTNQRLFIERGIFSRTLDQTELIRVDDVRMQQSFVNRIFGIGNITMLSTDISDRSVAIVGVKEPVRVTELVRQQMRTLRGKSVYIETL